RVRLARLRCKGLVAVLAQLAGIVQGGLAERHSAISHAQVERGRRRPLRGGDQRDHGDEQGGGDKDEATHLRCSGTKKATPVEPGPPVTACRALTACGRWRSGLRRST